MFCDSNQSHQALMLTENILNKLQNPSAGLDPMSTCLLNKTTAIDFAI